MNAQQITTNEYFGGCPECGETSGYVNIERSHYGRCDEHKVYWPIGANLFSSWRQETEEDWQRNRELLGSYHEVAPIFPTPERAVELGYAEPTPHAGPIIIQFVYTNFFARRHCHVCGGLTDKDPIIAEGEAENGGTVRVCDRCLKAGNINARLEEHAAALEKEAAERRALIGRLQVPTWEEWKRAWATADKADSFSGARRYFARRDGEDPPRTEGDLNFEGTCADLDKNFPF